MFFSQEFDKLFRSKIAVESDYFSLLLWVENHGGLNAILTKFQQHDLQQSVTSWLADGANFNLYPEQVLTIINIDELDDLAIECDTNLLGAAKLLATAFPRLVDAMSEHGTLRLPPANDFVSTGIDVLCQP